MNQELVDHYYKEIAEFIDRQDHKDIKEIFHAVVTIAASVQVAVCCGESPDEVEDVKDLANAMLVACAVWQQEKRSATLN